MLNNIKTFFASALLRYARADQGIAAIEAALVLPILILMYVGMIDITGLISQNRKVTQASDIIAALSAQQKTYIYMNDAQDYFNAVDMVLSSTGVSNATEAAQVKADIRGYRKTITNTTTGAFTVNKIWTATKPSGGCSINPSTTKLGELMTEGNDLVVATVCTSYQPAIAYILGRYIVGQSVFTLSEQIISRPRTSKTLDCRLSTTNTTACSVN